MTSIPSTHQDLLNAKFATIGTVGKDGRPQLSEVWFLADGENIQLSLNTDRQKIKNLQRNPAVNLFILDPTDPFRYLEIRGDATLEDDPNYEFADKVGEKYDTDLRSFDGPNASRVVLTIHPTKVNAVSMGN